MKTTCVGLMILLACLCRSGHPSEPAESMAAPPSVVLIVSDALRADVLGCYGGAAATPNIDRLAGNGMLFESAFSNATWTVPSAACMFTGKYPNAYPYEVIVKNDRERNMCLIPHEAVVTWKELARRGYDLSCYIENGLVTYTGALYGIETMLTHAGLGSEDTRRIDELLGDEVYAHKRKYYPVLDHILKMPPDRPFLLLVWFLDPHAPYRPPREGAGDIDARCGDLANGVNYYRDLTAFEVRDMGAEFNEAETGLLRELYLGEVESIDGRVGNILRALRHAGRLDDTYFIFTSDHGEAFGEHDQFCHGGPDFYGELIHVPLIIAGPGLPKGADISTQVSHVQIIPTIRSLLNLGPGDGSSVKSLVDPAVTAHREVSPLYFASTDDTCYAVADGAWKLMVNGAEFKLFNLADDPGELTNVYGRFPEVAARLSGLGARITAENVRHRKAIDILPEAKDEREAETREIKRTLRSLGYVR